MVHRVCLSPHAVNAALQEPFGLTLIEAAAAGVPSVATCYGGPVDIHRTLSNGLLVEPTDVGALSRALLTLLTNRELWRTCRASGLRNIHAYSWPHHAQRYLQASGPIHLRMY